jgi:ABC-2 type transport system ATP-binding protein
MSAELQPGRTTIESTPDLAIDVRDVTRVYNVKPTRPDEPDTVVALDGVSLEVPAGELFGLLGPNGAGKTTLIKILVTLLLPSSGEAFVRGINVATNPGRVRERISMVSGGEHSGYGLLTVREQLWMFSQFYGVPATAARERIEELLTILGMADVAGRRVSSLSTGMRQKMNLIRGLVSDPEVLFLDEPTVGLDVGAARDIREYIRTWMAEQPGRTVLLTTHYLHEADALCDRIAIIHRGKIQALGTPRALRNRASGESYFVITTDPAESENWLEALPGVRGADAEVDNGQARLRLQLEEDAALATVISSLAAQGRKVYSLEKVEPSLEDVFIEIVGNSSADSDDSST